MSRNKKYAVYLSLLLVWMGSLGSTGYGQGNKEPVMVRLNTEWEQTYHSEATGITKYRTAAYEVPQGKRLVIEHVFFELLPGSSTVKPTAKIRINASPLWATLPLPLEKLTDYTGNYVHTADRPTRIYVIPSPGGSSAWMWIEVTAITGNSMFCSGAYFSGYLENIS